MFQISSDPEAIVGVVDQLASLNLPIWVTAEFKSTENETRFEWKFEIKNLQVTEFDWSNRPREEDSYPPTDVRDAFQTKNGKMWEFCQNA